jgi:hypothetical protein
MASPTGDASQMPLAEFIQRFGVHAVVAECANLCDAMSAQSEDGDRAVALGHIGAHLAELAEQLADVADDGE